MAKQDRYFIAICEVRDKYGIVHTIERLGNAWGYSLQCGTPTTGKLVRMRECSKEEFFNG